ncbi:MAG: phosphatase PAP2 family protein [Bacillota bacterium]|nr:phosphatase PAP2 family protein [Bacillota bacterium]
MKKETYVKMMKSVSGSPLIYNLIVWVDRILTRTVYLAYPLFLIVLFIQKDTGLIRAVLVPGISFIIVSVFRKMYDAPRPYVVFDTPSVIKKETLGKSFPSRHIFSIFIIASTVFRFFPTAGVLLGTAGVVMAASRVLGGVHFPKDVIAGAVVGIIFSVIGFAV